jgi:hypothetical protein
MQRQAQRPMTKTCTWLQNVSKGSVHGRHKVCNTIKSQRYKFQAHIPQANIQTCCGTARADLCQIHPLSHDALAGFLMFFSLTIKTKPSLSLVFHRIGGLHRIGFGVNRFSTVEPRGPKSREQIKHERRQGKLDNHVQASNKKREMEVEMVRRKHPLVILYQTLASMNTIL